MVTNMTNFKTATLATALALTSLSATALDIRDIHLGDAWDTKVLKAKLHLEGDPVLAKGDPTPTITCTNALCLGAINVLGIKVTVQRRIISSTGFCTPYAKRTSRSS